MLTEDQAGNESQPLKIPLHSEVDVKLVGSESNSIVYSSGSGDQHGERWEFDESSENNIFSELSDPEESIIHSHHIFLPGNSRDLGWVTEPTKYNWALTADQVGLATLTFKKYYYSNSTVRNLDGSLPWKDPIKEIHFTIQVVDDAVGDPVSSK